MATAVGRGRLLVRHRHPLRPPMPSTDDAEDDILARFRDITAGLNHEVFGDRTESAD